MITSEISQVSACTNGGGIGFVLDWNEIAKGYGQITIITKCDKTLIHAETMSKEFVIAALTALVNDAELVS